LSATQKACVVLTIAVYYIQYI